MCERNCNQEKLNKIIIFQNFGYAINATGGIVATQLDDPDWILMASEEPDFPATVFKDLKVSHSNLIGLDSKGQAWLARPQVGKDLLWSKASVENRVTLRLYQLIVNQVVFMH